MTIAGWFFDRLAHFPALGRWVARNAHDALDALALLAQNNRHALLPAHPGFPVIVSAWPGLEARSRAKAIGRSVAFIQFGGQVSNDFELIARGADESELSPRWRHTAAAKEFQSRIDNQTFWYGTVVFWLGIAVTLTAGLIDLIGKP